MDILADMGIACDGWDPVHRPSVELQAAPIVDLGYIINVVEDQRERAETLRKAWSLCQTVLVVSAQSPAQATGSAHVEFSDGVLASRGTFQKYYTHQELRDYLQQGLQTDAIAAAPNVFYLFKSEEARQQFTARRFRQRIAVPRRRVSEQLYEQNQDVLEPFTAALTDLGRLPEPEELPEYTELVSRFGTAKRASLVVRRATGSEPWTEITRRRRDDLLVYLALARFGRRQPLSRLPLSTQRDVKAFMGTYQRACEEANGLLFSVGRADLIDAACQRSPIGRLVENALLVERKSLPQIEPILRICEGCARVLLGEMDAANVVKIHRHSGKVSYLVYQDNAADAHPPLRLRVKVNLRTQDIAFFDYSNWEQPPLLDIPVTFMRGAGHSDHSRADGTQPSVPTNTT